MKLISLAIQGLYNCYNYDVKFNEDITFIYGLNGCGKTTVLNITEAIITGQLFKLFDYKFKSIELCYAPNYNLTEIKKIQIKTINEQFEICFNEALYQLWLIKNKEPRISEDVSIKTYRQYFDEFDFLEKIKETFNYVYLPLTRTSTVYDYEHRFFAKMNYGMNSNRANFNRRDKAMLQIEDLVHSRYTRMMFSVNKINEAFRNDILKSSLEVHPNFDLEKFFLDIFKGRDILEQLTRTKEVYIKMLKDLKLIDQEEEYKYNEFFSEFALIFEKAKKENFSNVDIDLIFKYQEISKITGLLSAAENAEKRKMEAKKPIETFLHIMNEFIGNNEDKKEIKIDDMGDIYFTTKYNQKPINIQYLSSGEKQLLVFFANLIFNVKDTSFGIFVVDEPELSLHLSWQRKFIDKIMELNKNVQFIFATHAPEIIGKNREKMFKLEKQYVKADDENE